jgi:hypothetical protein
MGSFLILSSLFGVMVAMIGFYSSVRLDLPLGPTDVTLGCCAIFLAYGMKRVTAKSSAATLLILVAVSMSLTGCSGVTALPVPGAKSLRGEQLWLAKVKNSTALPLLLPSVNPLRSLAEMAGKLSPDYRQNVMDLLRENLQTELVQQGFQVTLPEDKDVRFPPFSANATEAARVAREGKLSGLIFVSEIWRWEGETQKFVRALVDFKLVRIDDGSVVWARHVQRAISTPSATNLGQASTDAAKALVHELFAG